MIDIKLIRENPELVKENIRKKFQDEKIPMVDEVIALDQEVREVKQKGDALRADRNRMSKEIGGLMKNGQREEAEKIIIQENLAWNNNNKSKTADILGIGRKTLHRKIEEWENAQ